MGLVSLLRKRHLVQNKKCRMLLVYGCSQYESQRLLSLSSSLRNPNGVYLHHVVGGASPCSTSVTLGLLHALIPHYSLGFFCPIDRPFEGSYRSVVMREICQLKNLSSMHGVMQQRALELTMMDKTDDLMEEILKAYEMYKVHHDFIIVEGNSLTQSGDGMALLNAKIARTLGLPALFIVNARKAAGVSERGVDICSQQEDWEKEVVQNTKLTASAFAQEHVEVVGTIAYDVPSTKRDHNNLQNLMLKYKLPFLGAIPENRRLKSAKVYDMATTLGVEVRDKDGAMTREALFDGSIDLGGLQKKLSEERPIPINSQIFLHGIFSQARKSQQMIVLPEGEEVRTIQAAGKLLEQSVCKLTLLGNVNKIKELAKELCVDLRGSHMIDISKSEHLQEYAHSLLQARKHKGMTYDKAYNILLEDVNYFGSLMVSAGHADGMVSGASHTTADTVRPALQLIKTKPGIPIASSVYFMCLKGEVYVFGDCAINVDPTSEELASIAIASADTARTFGIEPRVAMLSYATSDSNSGPMVQKVIDATMIARKKRPEMNIDGPLQFDAAVNPNIARIKLRGKSSSVAGKANVLIFPDLNTGNNTFKAIQQFTGATAVGIVIQGLRKPVNDLSRGCTVDDIVATVAITAVQAAASKMRNSQSQ